VAAPLATFRVPVPAPLRRLILVADRRRYRHGARQPAVLARMRTPRRLSSRIRRRESGGDLYGAGVSPTPRFVQLLFARQLMAGFTCGSSQLLAGRCGRAGRCLPRSAAPLIILAPTTQSSQSPTPGSGPAAALREVAPAIPAVTFELITAPLKLAPVIESFRAQ